MVPPERRSLDLARSIALVAACLVAVGWAEVSRVTASSAMGALSIVSDPDGAAAYVDGRFAGATPVNVVGIVAGAHNVRIVKSGYLENSRILNVVAGQPTQLKVKLTRLL